MQLKIYSNNMKIVCFRTQLRDSFKKSFE